jgi:hypothetical protein
MLATKD